MSDDWGNKFFDALKNKSEPVGASSDNNGLLCVLPVPKPETGRRVKAVVKSRIGGTWDAVTAFLIAVDESDCDWRFADDNAELSYSADVVYWEYADA